MKEERNEAVEQEMKALASRESKEMESKNPRRRDSLLIPNFENIQSLDPDKTSRWNKLTSSSSKTPSSSKPQSRSSRRGVDQSGSFRSRGSSIQSFVPEEEEEYEVVYFDASFFLHKAKLHQIVGVFHFETSKNLSNAQFHIQECLNIRREYLESHHSDLEWSLQELAIIFTNQSEFEKSVDIYNELIPIVKDIRGESSWELAAVLNNYSTVLDKVGNLSDAKSQYEQTLKILKKLHQNRDDANIAGTLFNLANISKKLEKFEESQRYFEDCVNMRSNLYPGNHPILGVTLQSYGTLLFYSLGRISEGKLLLEKAQQIFKSSLGPDHPKTIQITKILDEA